MTDDPDDPQNLLSNADLSDPLHTLTMLLVVKVCMLRQQVIDLVKYRELQRLIMMWAALVEE